MIRCWEWKSPTLAVLLKPFPGFRFGSSDRAFGTPGMGGSFGFADPDQQVGFAYVRVRLRTEPMRLLSVE